MCYRIVWGFGFPKYSFRMGQKGRTMQSSPKYSIRFARTPEIGTSVGVRGLSGDNLLSKDNG